MTAGKAAGEKLKEMGGKDALCVNQEVGNVALDSALQGLHRGLRRQGDRAAGLERTRPRCRAKVKAALAANADVDTILALGAGTAASRRSPRSRTRANRARSMSRPSISRPGFLKAVAAGEAAFAIDQQQFLQGYLPVVFLANYAKYGLIPGGNVALRPEPDHQGQGGAGHRVVGERASADPRSTALGRGRRAQARAPTAWSLIGRNSRSREEMRNEPSSDTQTRHPGQPAKPAQIADERLRKTSFLTEAMRRPELGALAGLVLVIIFFLFTANRVDVHARAGS